MATLNTNFCSKKRALALDVCQRSIAGLKSENQDATGIRIPDADTLLYKGAVSIIADGVSAADNAKKAAEICVINFLSDYYSTPESWSVKQSAEKVLTALNRWLYQQSFQSTEKNRGYLSTLTVVILKSCTAYVFHVGDTRLYRYRAGELQQLTHDHTVSVSNSHRFLSRAMGLDEKVDVDFFSFNIKKDDLLLLTSDGIHDVISNECFESFINSSTSNMAFICNKAIETALQKGSRDNLSIQCIKVQSLPKESADDIYKSYLNLPFPPELNNGAVIDNLTITDTIHLSERSQIYRVIDNHSQHGFIMKTPSRNYIDDIAYIESFVFEPWIAKRLNSPYIIKTKDHFPRSYLYYLTEDIDGQTLSQWSQRHPNASIQDVMYLIQQIIKGVQAFHRKETLHLDLKPENILISKDGIIKIIDFGSCHIAAISEISRPYQRLYNQGDMQFSSPEIKLQSQLSSRADQFSIAAIAYYLLTRHYPYNDNLQHCKTMKEFRSLDYIPSYQFNPHIPFWMDNVLKQALSILPENRHNELSEFLFALKHPQKMIIKDEAMIQQCNNHLVQIKRLFIISITINILLSLIIFL